MVSVDTVTHSDPTHPVPDDTSESLVTQTFLFTDMEGSTARWESTPEMPDVVERHFGTLHDAVQAHRGIVFATMGDGIAAAFDSAGAAAHAARDAQLAFVRDGVAVRMGLHTGEVLRVGDDFRGRTLNRASRISAVGHGGQILLSGVTAHFIRTGPEPVTLLELGLHRLRDLAEPERLWQLVDDDLPIEFPLVRSLDSFSHNLPVQRSEFVGREREVSHIVASLQQHRVVTLIGPGGVGKTRLALQAAAELPTHGSTSWFVSLGGVDDGHDVLRAIAIAAGVDNVQQPSDALRSAFGVREVQLVIDNCEHIIDGVAAAVEQLTDECRGLRVLATSREALAIEGEFVIPVRPLDPDGDGLELFEVRARASGAPISPDHARSRGRSAIGSTGSRSPSSWPRHASPRSD